MKFIKIADNFSVKKEDIEAIYSGEDGYTIIQTHHNFYKSIIPYTILLEFLEKEEPEEDKQELNILKTIGTFAG